MSFEPTPSQQKFQREHTERRLRIASKAVVDRPIDLRNRKPKPPVGMVHQITITDNSNHQQAKIDRLLEQLSDAHNEIDILRAKTDPILKVHPHPIHRIIRMVCKGEHVTKSDIMSQRRSRSVCFPRQIAFYLAATTTIHSLPVIGRYFGGRDHTTILHGKRKIEMLRGTDALLDDRLKWYEEQLKIVD